MNTKFETKKGYYTKQGVDGTFEFEFATDLTLYDKSNLIANVVNALVREESKTYYSIQKDIMFKFYLIQTITDIDVSYITNKVNIDLPEIEIPKYQLEEIEKLVNETNICEILIANIGDLFEELYKELNKALTYKTGIKEDFNNVILSAQKFLNILINNFSENNIEELIQAATNIGKINDSPITAEGIVKAFQKSDDYQGSKEVIEEKNNKIVKLEEKLKEKEEQ